MTTDTVLWMILFFALGMFVGLSFLKLVTKKQKARTTTPRAEGSRPPKQEQVDEYYALSQEHTQLRNKLEEYYRKYKEARFANFFGIKIN